MRRVKRRARINYDSYRREMKNGREREVGNKGKTMARKKEFARAILTSCTEEFM